MHRFSLFHKGEMGMKRSEVNKALRELEAMVDEAGYPTLAANPGGIPSIPAKDAVLVAM